MENTILNSSQKNTLEKVQKESNKRFSKYICSIAEVKEQILTDEAIT